VTDDPALAIALSAAVPLRILEYERSGGPSPDDVERARRYANVLAEKGDRLLFRSKKPGETADMFNGLADAVAVMAFCPGGVTTFGQHYEATVKGDCMPKPVSPRRPAASAQPAQVQPTLSPGDTQAAGRVVKHLPAPANGPLFPINWLVILLSGPFDSGKTIAAVTLDPHNTCYFDTEGSAAPYADQYGLKKWADLPRLTVLAKKTASPANMFLHLRDLIRQVKPGDFRVGVIDTCNVVEDGIASHVQAHAKDYRLPTADVGKINALFWAAVKGEWNALLIDAQARFDLTLLITHEKEEYKGSQTTGRKVPGGKDTLLKLCSACFMLERPFNHKSGDKADVPNARLYKGRASVPFLDQATGELTPRRLLPPVIPQFTFGKLRWYMANPPDFSNLAADERVPEERPDPDERLRLEAQKAHDLAEAERARAQREERQREWAERKATQAVAPPTCPPGDPQNGPAAGSQRAGSADAEGVLVAPAVPSPRETPPAGRPDLDVLESLRREAFDRGMPGPVWESFLRKNGLTVNVLSQALPDTVKEVVHKLASRLDMMDAYDSLYGDPADSPGKEVQADAATGGDEEE
jgi:hypothetical protein